MVTLVVANYLWKFTVHGDESTVAGDTVTWLGLNLTPVFDAYARHIAAVVFAIIRSMKDTIYMTGATTLRWISGHGTHIVWSCTPIKQSFIWLCLLLTTSPILPLLDRQYRTAAIKIGWTMAGLVAIYAFNILRIVLITLALEHHPEWFELLHTYIFKYLFYAMMFLLWVIYVEKLKN